MKNKLNKLESIRGFAAIYVVLHHMLPHVELLGYDLTWVFKFGQEAVILFFLLSGFVIGYSFSFNPDKSFKTYFNKRFLRIYVPLILVFGVEYVSGDLWRSMDLKSWHMIGNLLMLQDLPALKPHVIVAPFMGNSPLWSLSYEWWFYMLFFPLNKYGKNHASLIVGAVSICAALTYVIYPNFVNRELMYFCIWWLGIAAARLYVQGVSISIMQLRNELMPVFGITLILLVNALSIGDFSHWGIHPLLELRHFSFSLFVLIFAMQWKKLNWYGFMVLGSLFTWIAPISYEIYISHYLVIRRSHYFISNFTSPSLIFLVETVICLGYALLIHQIYNYLTRRLGSYFRLTR